MVRNSICSGLYGALPEPLFMPWNKGINNNKDQKQSPDHLDLIDAPLLKPPSAPLRQQVPLGSQGEPLPPPYLSPQPMP